MVGENRRILIILGDNFNADVFHEIKDCLKSVGITVVIGAVKRDIELIDNKGNELIRPDIGIEAHGGRYENEPVWVDGNLITGRMLEDLPAFCKTLIDEIRLNPAA